MKLFKSKILIFLFYCSYDEYINLNPNNYRWGLDNKGDLLKELKRYDEAL